MKTNIIFLDLTKLCVSLHIGKNLLISGNDSTNPLQREQADLQASFAQLTGKSPITYLLNVCFKVLHKSM